MPDELVRERMASGADELESEDGGTLMTATFSLFPLLGRTPPPWRWPAAFVLTSLATHAIYAGAVAGVDDALAHETEAQASGPPGSAS